MDTTAFSRNPYAQTLKKLQEVPKLSLDDVQHLIRRKIGQMTAKDTDQLRHVFQMFGRPKAGITPRMFRRQLHTNFGVRLNSSQARELFDRYDKEGTGSISLQKFVMRVMPQDYTRKLWNVERDEEVDRQTMKKLRSGHQSVYVEKMPASLNKVRWTIDKIEKKIQQKIIERTKRASDQYREAYALFGSPQHGISRTAFRHHMQKLGFVLTDQELNALFDRYDSDGSGTITFAELVAHVMPKDYTRKPWNLRRDEEMELEEARRKQHQAPVLQRWPNSLHNNRQSMHELEQAIQLKIIERTKRANDQYREAYAMFGSPADGITPKHFYKILTKLGLVLSQEQVGQLFNKYDSDGSGRISFQELVAHVMPKDYTEKPWNIVRDLEIDRQQTMKKTSHFEPVAKKWPSSWGNNRWSVEQIELAIQQKIIERTKRASDQFREAFALFGSPAHGISPSAFKVHLQNLGLVVSEADLKRLFERYDTDGSGSISFSELVDRVMPKDYTRPSWNIVRDMENDAIEEAKRQLVMRDSPFYHGKRPGAGAGGGVANGAMSRRSTRSRRSGRMSSRSSRRGIRLPPTSSLARSSSFASGGMLLTGRSVSHQRFSSSLGAPSPIRSKRRGRSRLSASGSLAENF